MPGQRTFRQLLHDPVARQVPLNGSNALFKVAAVIELGIPLAGVVAFNSGSPQPAFLKRDRRIAEQGQLRRVRQPVKGRQQRTGVAGRQDSGHGS